MESLVSGVLDRSRRPKVFPPVVCTVAIDMVDAVRHLSTHEGKCQAVQALVLLVDHHDQIAICGFGCRDRSCLRAALVNTPDEQPAVRLIAQQFFEVALIFEHAGPMPGHARAAEWQFEVGLWFIAASFS